MFKSIKYFIPLLLLVYVSLLGLDDYAMKNSIKPYLDKKINGFKVKNSYTNLILGGSNAFYSLSAEQLSEASKENWYNLSLSGEAYNNRNYYNFLRNNFLPEDRYKIKKIFYSSIYYYRKGSILSRKNSYKSIFGSYKYSIKPSFSGFTYIKRYLIHGSFLTSYPNQNSFGDIIFNPTTCNNKKIKEGYKIESFEIIYMDMMEKNNKLKELFPNAEIYFIFPSDYIKKENTDSFKNNVIDMISYFNSDSKIGSHINIQDRTLFQKPFTPSQLCDTPSHSNFEGRKYRTQEVIDNLLD
jgi:hypothetical protein